MMIGGAGRLDRGVRLVARAAIFCAVASPVIVLDGAYFPYTVGRAVVFDRCADLALIAWLVLLARGAIVPRATPTTLLLLAFAGWILVTALTGANPARSFGSTLERSEGAPSWARAALLLLVADGVFVGAAARRALLVGATAAAMAVLIVALAAIPSTSLPLQGAMGNSGLLAGYLLGALALPLLVARDRAAGLALRMAAMAATGALLLGLALTFDRAVLAALALAAVAAAVTRLRQRGAVLAAILVAGSIVATLLVANDPRAVAWQAALAGIAERPLLGWGVENFNLPFDRHRQGAAAEAFFDRAHNALLDWAIAGGLVGAVLYVAPLLRGLARASGDRSDPRLASPAAIRTGAIVAKLAFGAFWFDQPATLLLLGLLLASGDDVLTPRRTPIVDAWRAPLAIASCAGVMFAWQSVGLVRQTRDIGAALAAGAVTALPSASGATYAARQDLRLLMAQLLLGSLRQQPRRPTYEEIRHATEALEDFASEAPLDCRGPLLASLLFEAADMPEFAEEARARARQLAPAHPAILRHDRLVAQR